MAQDNRARLKQWLESGEARLQPLTFPQRELWEASPVPVGDVSNHICAFIKVRGVIAPRDGQAALQRVVARQEALRLSFLPGKEQPLQLIRSTVPAAMNFRDLPPEQRSQEAVEELMREIFEQPFDMLRGPLYRVEMLRRAPDDLLLVFAIHHAIADGWTLGVFVQELVAAYMMGVRGIAVDLPPVPLSYSDWGATERAFWDAAKLENLSRYWKTQLSGSERLWKAEEGGQAPVRNLARWISSVPAELATAIRDVARRSSVTLFSTLLAAFQVALSRWTGGKDIVVGTPIANRAKQVTHETMGYVAGNVPLRSQVDSQRSFADSLRAVDNMVVESMANAMPFVELARALGEKPTPNYNPIFDVRFALQNHPIPEVNLPGLSAKLSMRSTGTSRFNLGCEVTEEGNALEVVWLSRPDIFSASDVREIDRIYRAVLDEVCRSPESRIAALSA